MGGLQDNVVPEKVNSIEEVVVPQSIWKRIVGAESSITYDDYVRVDNTISTYETTNDRAILDNIIQHKEEIEDEDIEEISVKPKLTAMCFLVSRPLGIH